MKAILEVVKYNVSDVVTASTTICGEDAPVITPPCDLPGIDDQV